MVGSAKKTLKIPSAQELAAKAADKSNSNDTPIAEEEVSEEILVGKKSFSFEELSAVWAEYIQKQQDLGKSKELPILKKEFKLLNSYQIELVLAGNLEKDIFDGFKAELITYLRTKLENSGINVTARVEKEAETKTVYTNKEKFNHLSEKYPALEYLRQRLELDTDF